MTVPWVLDVVVGPKKGRSTFASWPEAATAIRGFLPALLPKSLLPVALESLAIGPAFGSDWVLGTDRPPDGHEYGAWAIASDHPKFYVRAHRNLHPQATEMPWP